MFFFRFAQLAEIVVKYKSILFEEIQGFLCKTAEPEKYS